ncbi:MAG TPA: TadG family pilus assembly protein [Candidatus Binataceae bacterium]|jgi:Flp pilus assembly protein TadG|nr:TadG family pilus assembly protein [Candidatus Binataceae bacterium]
MARRIDVASLLRRFKRRPPGQTFLLISIALVVLLGVSALAVDIGDLWTTRRLMQSAADAGAVAGADEIAIGGSSTAITAAAKDAASHNGFADGGTRPGTSNTITVAVHNPPTSGPYAANSNAVEVDVSQTQPTYFMKVLGMQTVPVSTTAVAVTTGSGSCIYSLDPSVSDAVDVGGTASVSSACGMYVNSDSSSALIVHGGGTITAPLVGVVGGTTISGGGSSPPSTGIAQFGDPLAYIAEPNIGSNPCPGGFHTQNLSNPSYSPQTFCGGIKITGGSVNFTSGLYIIDGGGITFNGGTITGTGVTFYLTGNNGKGSSAANYSGVTINGNATVNFSSPCTSSGGSIAGMLFFQDRSITNGAASSINGSSGSTFSGAIYFPTTPLAYAGNTGSNMFTLLISDSLSFLGNSTVGNNFSCLADGSLIKDAALVE